MKFSFFNKKSTLWLNDYPPYEQPYAAVAGKLTKAQAAANFTYFLSNKESRINNLANLLTTFDIDLHRGINDASPDGLVNQLYQWSGEHWPQYFDKAIHNNQHWMTSNKHDRNIVYSVIMDTSIVLGELIIKHRPSYSWALDNMESNKAMPSYNRCVLTAPWLPEAGKLIVIDVEAEVAQRFLYAHYSGQRHEELWLKLVNDCVSGSCEGAHLVI